MEFYALVTYLAVIIGLVLLGLLKISDIFEQKRDRKYYQMIRDDAGFWQMKIEQSGMNIGDDIIRTKELEDKIEGTLNEDKVDNFHKALNDMKDGLDRMQEHLDKIKEDQFEGMDDWLPF